MRARLRGERAGKSPSLSGIPEFRFNFALLGTIDPDEAGIRGSGNAGLAALQARASVS